MSRAKNKLRVWHDTVCLLGVIWKRDIKQPGSTYMKTCEKDLSKTPCRERCSHPSLRRWSRRPRREQHHRYAYTDAPKKKSCAKKNYKNDTMLMYQSGNMRKASEKSTRKYIWKQVKKDLSETPCGEGCFHRCPGRWSRRPRPEGPPPPVGARNDTPGAGVCVRSCSLSSPCARVGTARRKEGDGARVRCRTRTIQQCLLAN